MAEAAERLFAHCGDNRLDFMLLFWLRHPEIMNQGDLCTKLRKLLEDFGVSTSELERQEFRAPFFNYLREKLAVKCKFIILLFCIDYHHF